MAVTDLHSLTLGSRIRAARLEAGFTNSEQLAVRLRVGQRTVQRWETGKSDPTIEKLIEVAKATGKPLAFFLEAAAEDAA